MALEVLQIGIAIGAIGAVVAFGALLLERRRARPYHSASQAEAAEAQFAVDRELEIIRELEILRDEYVASIESARVASDRAGRIGQAVIAAVKPVELGLRDLSSRVGELEQRSGAAAEPSAESNWSFG